MPEDTLDEAVYSLSRAAESFVAARLDDEVRDSIEKTALREAVREAMGLGIDELSEAVLMGLGLLPQNEADSLVLQSPASMLKDVVQLYRTRRIDSGQPPAGVQRLRVARLKFLKPKESPTKVKTNPWLGEKLASATLLIHGSSGAHESWWRYGSPFHEFLATQWQDLYGFDDSFNWSGGVRSEDIRDGATELIDWLARHVVDDGKLRLVCHSHGGNVAMHATRLGLQVDDLVLLGTPLRTEFPVDVRSLKRVFNVYVPWDIVQFPLGALPWPRGDGRTLCDTDKIVNLPIVNEVAGWHRSHSALHTSDAWRANGLVDELR